MGGLPADGLPPQAMETSIASSAVRTRRRVRPRVLEREAHDLAVEPLLMGRSAIMSHFDYLAGNNTRGRV
jgi:hypothetical protein